MKGWMGMNGKTGAFSVRRGAIRAAMNVVLLVAVAVVLVFSVFLVRNKMLQNTQALGMALARSYAAEAELHLSTLQQFALLAGEYLDETGALHTLTGEEHGFGYRRSVFRDHPDWTVVRSTLRLQQGDPAAILDRMNDLAQRRREKQPLNFPSAGSTFKRPEGYFAGRLIEDAGLKGVSVGAAQVSEKHAGFLINRGGATCDDMLHLIELVQKRVKEAFGVQLECEVRIIR